jgi:predicted alpha/beta superfamily hydrolase
MAKPRRSPARAGAGRPGGRPPIAVEVVYPRTAGQIVLRTDRDWQQDVEPVGTREGGQRSLFELPADRPFVYFKPVLLRAGEGRWSQGDNFLALADADHPLAVYPHFEPDSRCSVCELRRLAVAASGESHHYRVFYPPGYHENTLRRYPVLYMQDGQNLFFPGEAFQGEHWRIAETLTLLDSMNALQQVIVVGIYPGDRVRDYTRPGYEAYGRFLVEELKPAIDAGFRTLTAPRETAVMGSSLGGVVSFYLAWQHPRVFGMAACMSSTFGWRDDLLERVAGEAKPDIRLYLDSGWPSDNYEVTRNLRECLLRRGFSEGVDLLYLAFPQALHDERSWAMRAHIPFQHLFGRRGARGATA